MKVGLILIIFLLSPNVWAERKDQVNLFELYNACRNIDGVDFSKINRPAGEDVQKDLIRPRDTIKCVQELVQKELLFSHEINNTFTVSLDFDRRVKQGDLNDFTANIQNIRKVLTNRFGDTMTLYDFNRSRRLIINLVTMPPSFRGNCIWLLQCGRFLSLSF